MADITTEFPNTPSFQTVDFKVITPTITSETASGKKRRVGQGISYYTWTAKYAPLTPRDAGPIIGFIRYAEGPLYSFEVILPEISFSKCFSQPNTVVTRANLAIGSANVTVDTSNYVQVTILSLPITAKSIRQLSIAIVKVMVTPH